MARSVVWLLICVASLLAASVQAELVQELVDGVGKLLGPSKKVEVKAAGEHAQAKCLFDRKHEFKAPPRLFFYSRKQHAANTLGCTGKKAKKIVLRNQNGHHHMEPKLDADHIKRRLIDTQLFDGQLNTYFIVHGFQSTWNSSDWMCNLKDLLLNGSDANVFIVDWSGGSKPHWSIDYGMAVGNTQIAGLILGEFIDRLVELSGQQDASSYHLIGHSLGAHVCGFAGYHVQTLAKITALDPAGPCFRTLDEEEAKRARDTGHMRHGRRRLSRQSAKLVVAVHTDAALFGLPEECAHYDVFVNGGHQPFCRKPSVKEAIGGLLFPSTKQSRFFGPSCPHSFAYKLLGSFVRFFKKIGGKLNKNGKRKLSRYPSSLLTSSENEEDESQDDNEQADPKDEQCHLIGHQCANFTLFERGECGFCRDGDASCVFVGLNFDSNGKEIGPNYRPLASGLGENSLEDDNDYDDQEPNVEGDSRGGQLEWERPPVGSNAKLFIKTGQEGDVCLYHYQILVALDSDKLKSALREPANPIALHLPLEDKSANLIEIKHQLDPNGLASKRVREDFIDSLWEVDVKAALEPRDNLTFYTALATFGVAPGDKCAEAAGTALGDRLCKPFDRMEGARLWSADAKKLAAVRWAAVNYMSGLDTRVRRSRSFVLELPGERAEVIKRAALSKRLGTSAEGDSKMNFSLELRATRLDKVAWSSVDNEDDAEEEEEEEDHRFAREYDELVDRKDEQEDEELREHEQQDEQQDDELGN